MTGFAYLGALLVSLGGMALIDRRHRLAFWANPRRTAICLGVGGAGALAVVVYFLGVLAAIILGVVAFVILGRSAGRMI